MKKNIKNKVLAFTMASAMIVPNVAVVFAEAPKAGLAKVSKVATDEENVNYIKVNIKKADGSEDTENYVIKDKFPATEPATTEWVEKNYDYSQMLKEKGWKFDPTVYPNATDEPTTVMLTRNAGVVKEIWVVEDTKTVTVNYVDEKTNERISSEEITVGASETTANTNILKNIPSNYVLSYGKGDFYIGNGSEVTVNVRKAERTLYISYNDETTGESLGGFTLTVDADATYFNTSALGDLPEGYEICEVGDIQFGAAATVEIKVRKAAEAKKTVTVNYIDAKTKEKVGSEEIEVAADATTANYSILKNIPKNYTQSVTGDFYFGDKSEVEVEVNKSQRTLYVTYIDEATGDDVTPSTTTLTVDADATYFNTSALTNVPEGYEICEVGDIQFGTAATVEIEVRKATVTTVLNVEYITTDNTVVGHATSVKTTPKDGTKDVVFKLNEDEGFVLPEGYHLIDYNDQMDIVNDGIVLPAGSTGGPQIYVERDETKSILHVTFETKDGEQVGEPITVSKEFTVDETGTKVTNYVIGEDFDLPEGYHLVDGYFTDNTITLLGLEGGPVVIVEKDEEPAPTPSEDPKKDDDNKQDTTPTATPEATATPAATATSEAKKEEVKASKTANTADSSNIAAYAIPLAMSMIAIGAIVVSKKKLS